MTSSRPVWGGAGPRPPALEGIARPDVMRPADVEARRPLLCQRTCSRVPVSCFHSELLTPHPPDTFESFHVPFTSFIPEKSRLKPPPENSPAGFQNKSTSIKQPKVT